VPWRRSVHGKQSKQIQSVATGSSWRLAPRHAAPHASGVIRVCVFLVVASAFATAARADLSGDQVAKLPRAQIERRLPNEHPATYFAYAGRLWGEGASDKAVFWFYAGQLRFRFHLLANPNLPPDGDSALFASLFSTIGEPINLYVGGDTGKWMQQIDAVLAWDEKTGNGITSKRRHAKALEEVRTGLAKLRDHVRDNREMFREKREEQGIGRVGVVNGIYYEERNPRMPKDWPALEPDTTIAGIEGTYEAGFRTLPPQTFFGDSSVDATRATAFRLEAAAPDQVKITALRENTVLGSRTIRVTREQRALSFKMTQPPITAGLTEGTVVILTRLALNSAGELVSARQSVITGSSPKPVHLENTVWTRAKRIAPPTVPSP
jgi:hypothetical protein